MSHAVDWQPEGIFRRFSGFIHGDEILESNLAIYRDLRFLNARYIINDFSVITGASIDEAYLQAYASSDEMISQENHTFKIALVVPQQAYIGIAEKLCKLTKEKRFKYATFQTVEEAQKWATSEI